MGDAVRPSFNKRLSFKCILMTARVPLFYISVIAEMYYNETEISVFLWGSGPTKNILGRSSNQ
jgi:hypothetical protein